MLALSGNIAITYIEGIVFILGNSGLHSGTEPCPRAGCGLGGTLQRYA